MLCIEPIFHISRVLSKHTQAEYRHGLAVPSPYLVLDPKVFVIMYLGFSSLATVLLHLGRDRSCRTSWARKRLFHMV